MDKKVTSRQLQAAKSKDKVFRSAIKLFSLRGYDSVTIEDICNDAGVSKGLFYNYYPSKADILYTNFNEFNDIYLKIRDTFTDDDTSQERLLAIIERYFLHVYNNELMKETIRVIYINSLEKNNVNNILFNEDRELFKLIDDTIKYGQARGEIRTDLDVEAIKKHIFISILGMYFIWMANTSFSPAEYIKSHVMLIFKGIENSK